MNRKSKFWLALTLLAVCAAYSNSFQNAFHFDDFHTIVDNPAVRSLKNVPRFFTDATTFSVLPANRTYRPVVSTTLALDYWMGRGYVPLWFHVGTFALFLCEVWLLFALYRLLLDKVRPAAANEWLALLGAAWFGLHPAMAETVNYVIQRGDLYCTLGCVAALYLFARYTEWRRYGAYLLPFALAMLSKPPAAVFPVLLLLYWYFFEDAGSRPIQRLRGGFVAAWPSIAVTVVLLWLQSSMTPKSFLPSMISPWKYRLTQPYVWARYAAELFFPMHLNVDTDLAPFSSFGLQAVVGLLFLAALIAASWWSAKRTTRAPIAFGLLWFVVTQLPTSLYPLSEVENDHRMFFSFAGLVLAAVWGMWLMVKRLIARMPAETQSHFRVGLVAVALLVLIGYGYGVHRRNVVWRSEESLWLDDVQKSPHNGRGLMIYGLTQMNKGAYPVALDYFTQALEYTPNYPTLEINLGVLNGIMADLGDSARTAVAEQHFARAISLAPRDDAPHAYYGRWLGQHGRFAEALMQLQTAITLDPQRPFQRDVLIDTYRREGDLADAQKIAQETAALMPDDATALAMLPVPATQDVAYWVNLSLAQSRQGLNEESIASARKALLLDPNSAEAYVNIGAGYGAMGQWDEAIRNEHQALKLRPEDQLAKNNIAWYSQEKASGKTAPTPTVADYINESLHLGQAGQYEESIAASRKALALDPRCAEAWNNIAGADEAMHHWDEAIDAAQRAVALKPDFQLAKNNLAWSLSQKQLGIK